MKVSGKKLERKTKLNVEIYFITVSVYSLFNVLAETVERNDVEQSKNNFEEAEETAETVIEANDSPVEVLVLIISDTEMYC